MFNANCDSSIIISEISSSDSIEIYFQFTRRMFKSKLWREPWVLEFISKLSDRPVTCTIELKNLFILFLMTELGLLRDSDSWCDTSLALKNVFTCRNECYRDVQLAQFSLYRIYIVCVSLDKTPSASTRGRGHLVLPCQLINRMVH